MANSIHSLLFAQAEQPAPNRRTSYFHQNDVIETDGVEGITLLEAALHFIRFDQGDKDGSKGNWWRGGGAGGLGGVEREV